MTAAHRAAAITAAQKALDAEAKKKTTGPAVPLLRSALNTMQVAHELAKASDPGNEEASGVSKSTQLSESEVEDLLFAEYARLTRIPKGAP